jgi:hypothetical protein
MLWGRHPSSRHSDLVFARARIKLHFALSSISLYFLTGMIKIPRVCQKNFPIGWFLAALSPAARHSKSQHATTLLFFLTLCRLIKMLGLAWCLLPCDLLDIPHTNTRAHLSSSSLRRFSPALFPARTHSQPPLFLLFSVTEYLTHTPLYAASPLFHSAPNPRAAYIVLRANFPTAAWTRVCQFKQRRPQC